MAVIEGRIGVFSRIWSPDTPDESKPAARLIANCQL